MGQFAQLGQVDFVSKRLYVLPTVLMFANGLVYG